MGKNYIIVGASSGIGRALAENLAKGGNRVAILGRREKLLKEIATSIQGGEPSPILPVQYDANQFEKAKPVFDKILKQFNQELDGVFYATGVMPTVGENEFNTEKDLEMLNANLLGAVAFCNLAAAYFSTRGKGVIAGISSVAGDRGRRGNPVYNASKGGLNIYLEALRNRLAVKGVQVVTIKPGFVATDMLKDAKVPDKGFLKPIQPEKAAEIILSNIKKGKENFYVPGRWGLVMWIIRNIPSFIFKKLSI